MREPDGRFAKGTSGNPGGRRREGASFEVAARRILEGRVHPEALETAPQAARAVLPRWPTYHDALAAVLVTSSLAGDVAALRELLKRVWPAPRPVEITTEPIRLELTREHALPADPDELAEVLGILADLRTRPSESGRDALREAHPTVEPAPRD
jgi:hypothetical protein